MKIKLESPFKELYKFGYLNECNQEGRRQICLYNNEQDRTTISYARYLYSCNIGNLVDDKFEVDHINGNYR
jgi:hypothetical protein